MPLIRSANFNLFIEILVRVILISTFCYMENLQPFVRETHESDLVSIYKYPRRDSYVPAAKLWCIVLAVPFSLSLIAWAGCNDCNDGFEILLAWSLALGATGVMTDMFKLLVGRLRPDFFYRCFPDGVQTADLKCTGDPDVIMDGRKSFPSGHSSLSFCSLGTLSLWLCGRLGLLSRRRGSALRLVTCLAPLAAAGAIAVSRVNDYHHHWEDVVTGSILGLTIATFCYKQYYNPLSSENSGIPYIVINGNMGTAKFVTGKSDSPAKEVETTPLLARKEDKWI